MMEVVTTREFKDIIRFTIKNNLKQPILGIGAPGIGKSEIIKQVGDELGYYVEDLRLAQMSEVELCGLIYPNESKTETTWLIPDWFPKKDGPKTILLLDEITSASKRVQVAAYQLVLDRRLGRHFLPDNTVIIALGNGEEDGGVYEEMPAPLANRFEIYNVQMSAFVWLEDFAHKYVNPVTGMGVNQLVTSYIKTHPDQLHTRSENEDELVFASPRTWTRVSDILNVADISYPEVLHKIRACIGSIVGSQFYTFAKNFANNNMASEILKGIDVKVPDDSATQNYVIESLISIYNSIIADGTFTDGQIETFYNRICHFGISLPSELQVALETSLAQISPEIAVKALRNSNTIELSDTMEKIYGNEDEIDSFEVNKSDMFTVI